VFIILKHRIDIVIIGTVVSIHNKEDAIGMEKDAFCEPQECEPEVNHI